MYFSSWQTDPQKWNCVVLVSFVRDSNVILYHTRQSTETVKNTSDWHNVIWNYTADSYTALVYKDYMVDTYTELVHKLWNESNKQHYIMLLAQCI